MHRGFQTVVSMGMLIPGVLDEEMRGREQQLVCELGNTRRTVDVIDQPKLRIGVIWLDVAAPQGVIQRPDHQADSGVIGAVRPHGQCTFEQFQLIV